MGIMRGGNGGKSASTAKSASPDGLSMKGRTAPVGVNPNKGYPTAGNVSGDRGGMPGVKPANGGGRNAGGVHMGAAGSGHVMSESKRSSTPGYGNVHKSLKGKC